MATNYSYSLTTNVAVERTWLKDAMVVLGASVIIALFAPVSIPLPFTPIPISTQAHVILLLAAWLGSKRATMAVLLHLSYGAMGLPVFAGGATGILTLAGPRGGCLLGFLVAAFITGYIVERLKNRSSARVFAAMGVGNLVIYFFGIPWLARFVGWQGAFLLGMAPFVIGDLFKLLVASKVFKSVRA